jgi:hypothetical protein
MRTEVTPQKINKVMESRFGFTVDYDNLTFAKAQRLSKALSENIVGIKKSFGSHEIEKSAKYMELMLVKEGLDKWMTSEQGLFESELGRSEAVLAAKDIVDSVQDMLEKISKVQNEQVPALVDTIRDQIGAEQAEAFKSAISPMLADLYTALSSAREGSDTAVRVLSGEPVANTDMSMGGDEGGFGGEEELGAEPAGAELGAPPESDFDQEGGDEFNATDAAVGGEEELGRERR